MCILRSFIFEHEKNIRLYPHRQNNRNAERGANAVDKGEKRGTTGNMITVFTDGSCVQGNPGLASGAYVIMRNGNVLDSLGIPLGRRTNNAAELFAALRGLRAAENYLERNEDIILMSDSRYVISSMYTCNDYCKNPAKPNVELLLALSETLNDIWNKDCKVKALWVKGHHKNRGNKMCDKLARATARSQKYHFMMENGKECKELSVQGAVEEVAVV